MPAKQEPNIGINYGWSAGESGINLQLDENWRAIGALLQLSVVSKTDDLPAAPVDGDRYIIPIGATGDWSGLDGKVARYIEGGWEIYTPQNGWFAFVIDESLFYQFNGSIWTGASLSTATNVSFDPVGTSLSSTDTQGALEELAASMSSGGVADGGVQTVKLADYSYDPGTTVDLTFGYRPGRLRNGSTIVSTSADTVGLTASTTNYIELDKQGVVASNTTGFTNGKVPLYIVVTNATGVSTLQDKRAWLNVPDLSNYITRPDVNNQTGTTYTLVLNDENSVVRCSNANPVTITVPAEASANFPVGSIIQIRQVNAGQIALNPATGVTLNTSETLKSRKKGSTVALMKVGTDEWDVTGDMEASA